MKKTDIKTIDLTACEWFDRVNGNSYFTARLILNYELANEKVVLIPFQYGYGEFYNQAGYEALLKETGIKTDCYTLHEFCRSNGIILRTFKFTGRKKDCLNFIKYK